MEIELKAQQRERVGKNLQSLRKEGIIPAVVYGPGHKPISVQVNYEELKKVFDKAGESTLIKLKLGNEAKNVLIHDFAKDPISGKFTHVDFYHVRMDKAIKAEVPLVFEGEAPAVKTLEGVLVRNINHVEVEALPKDLPHEIKVDISGLDSFEKQIRAKDLKLPQGVKIELNPEEMVVSVVPPRKEEEIKAAAETAEPELAKDAANSDDKQANQPQSKGPGGEAKK